MHFWVLTWVLPFLSLSSSHHPGTIILFSCYHPTIISLLGLSTATLSLHGLLPFLLFVWYPFQLTSTILFIIFIIFNIFLLFLLFHHFYLFRGCLFFCFFYLFVVVLFIVKKPLLFKEHWFCLEVFPSSGYDAQERRNNNWDSDKKARNVITTFANSKPTNATEIEWTSSSNIGN